MLQVEVTVEDLEAAMETLVVAGARAGPAPARRLPPYCEPLLRAQLRAAAALLREPFPPAGLSG